MIENEAQYNATRQAKEVLTIAVLALQSDCNIPAEFRGIEIELTKTIADMYMACREYTKKKSL
jgi:hypothetical protein